MYKQRQKPHRHVATIVVALSVILLGLSLWALALAQSAYGLRPDARDRLVNFAKVHNISLMDYPRSILDLYERNPEAAEFALNYPLMYGTQVPADMSEYEGCKQVPLFLQWDERWGYMDYGDDVAGITGCGPVCLSMVAWYATEDPAMSPDRIITFALENGYCVPGSGSAWSLISQGGAELGLDVTQLPLDKKRIFSNLEVDNPVICVMGPGDFTTTGHFIVMTGCRDGKICINDPNSIVNSKKLWAYEDICDQILNLWAIRT